jgi:AraC-like DNA-binding protein
MALILKRGGRRAFAQPLFRGGNGAGRLVRTPAIAGGVKPSAPGGARLSDRKMRRVQDYVQSHLTQPIRVEDIARHAGMSRARFTRGFKNSTGKTAHQFVLEARVRRAQALLAGRGPSLAEVAARAGFSSAPHFSSVFRRLVKMTPSAYRAQLAPDDTRQDREILPRNAAIAAQGRDAPAGGAPLTAEFQVTQTSLLLDKDVRLLKSSRGLGWTGLYAAETDESPHERLGIAAPAVWLATADTPNGIIRVNEGRRFSEVLPEHAISIVAAGETAHDELFKPLTARHFYLRQDIVDDVAGEVFAGGRDRRHIRSAFGLRDPVLQNMLAAIHSALDEPPY